MRIEEILKQFKERFANIPNTDPRSTLGARDLISTLVFCFTRDRGNFRTLECIRKYVQTALNTKLSRGGFWERLATKRLRKYLETLASSMVQKMAGKLKVSRDILKVLNVKAILLLDSSSSSLPKGAKENFPAPRNNVAPAAIKLHLCFDLFLGAVNWFHLTPATTHDRKGFPPITSLVGKLIIFDLGYWDYLLLAEIKNIGGFFLSRVKTNAVIEVIKVVSGLPAQNFEGWHLFDRRFPNKKRKIVEVIGAFSVNYKPGLTARVIGFWNPLAKQYHWYVTNLDAPAELIYPLYRLRWQLELIFKAFKSSLRLADLPTTNSNIIYALVYSALIANMIAHPLAYVLALECKTEKLAPSFQRAVSVLVHVSNEFINFLLGRSGALAQLLAKLNLLKMELFDPNWRKRKTSIMHLFELAENYA